MLDAAHRGYEYQDLLTAIRLVDVLLGTIVVEHVDEKLFAADVFDDLTTRAPDGSRERTQFKHSEDADIPLPIAFFTSQVRDLRLDDLVACAVANRAHFGTDASALNFRIVVRNARPTDDELLRVLRPATPDPGPFLPHSASVRLRFDIDALWPIPLPPTQARASADRFAFLRAGHVRREDVAWLCERLIVEAEAPEARGDLAPDRAGPAERMLLERVRRELGAGLYPNEAQNPQDLAATLVTAARAARMRRLTVSVAELLRVTRLRTDFGAVARAHPVDPSRQIARENAVNELVERVTKAADAGQTLLIVGPPGQGKSWVCHDLVEALAANGWLLAEHYCYLGVADVEREARALAERVFGSLLARLAALDPGLVAHQRPRFAADSGSVVQAVEQASASKPNRRIALVVDGLDHVTRVLGPGRRDPSTKLAEALAGLVLPRGSLLIVLSQPGEHLRPLEQEAALTLTLPPLDRGELRALAERFEVVERHENATIRTDAAIDDELSPVVDALSERSAGNALYATYLCREVKRLPRGTTAPADTIQSLPAFDGTQEAYYNHLLESLETNASTVADLVALLDFPVTRDELRAILPASAHHVDVVLDRLGPVLIERSTQGGVRVYHESFARFLRGPLSKNPSAETLLLKQAADWLRTKGFFEEPRAFRFLIPTLLRAERYRDATNLIGIDFVASAVAAGFSASSIKTNLDVGVQSAARLNDWPCIVRCGELARAADTFEADRLETTFLDLADVPLRILGVDRLAARLLDEGRPVVGARPGLHACAAIDSAGGAAPWREYLAAHDRESANDKTSYGDQSDTRVALALFRGRLRIECEAPDDESPLEPSEVADWLNSVSLPARGLVDAICDTAGEQFAEAVIGSCRHPGRYALSLAERLACETGKRERVLQFATIAAGSAVPGAADRLFCLGLPAEALQRAYDFRRDAFLEATRAMLGPRSPEPSQAAAWLDSCAIAARVEPLALGAAEALISGDGWYRCWLRYVTALCNAEARTAASERSAAVADAFRLLAEDLRPFAGEPRACDLYQLHSLIETTYRRGLALVDDAAWAAAIAVLKSASSELTTTFQGVLSGPLPPDLFMALVIDTTTPPRREAGRAIVTEAISERSRGRLYDDLARFRLLAARAAIAAGDAQNAAAEWKHACRLMTAYGWHKDITIYELLDPLPQLIAADPVRARARLMAVQPLCRRVGLHTDRKETRGAEPAWWRTLAATDPQAAAELSADSLLSNANWPSALEDVRSHIWSSHFDRVDAYLASVLRFTLEGGLEPHDPAALLHLASRASGGHEASRTLLRLALARVDERSSSDSPIGTDEDRVARANEAAHQGGTESIQPLVRDADVRVSGDSAPGVAAEPGEFLDNLSREDFGTGTSGLFKAMRSWQNRPYDSHAEHWSADRFANVIGYRILETIYDGRSEEAEDALRVLAGMIRLGDETGLLESLAAGLETRGHVRLAAVAHTLTWTRTRGHGGWLSFGGETGLHHLRAAASLDRTAALDALVSEVRSTVNGRAYASTGVTQALVIAFASIDFSPTNEQGPTSPDRAFQCWDAAAAVIAERTPQIDAADDPRERYVPTSSPAPMEQPFSLAILAGLAHAGREQKRRALLAAEFLIEESGTIGGDAIAFAIERLSDPATLVWLLKVLERSGARGHSTIERCRHALLARSSGPHLTVRAIARRLLAAIRIEAPSPPADAPTAVLLRQAGTSIWLPSDPEEQAASKRQRREADDDRTHATGLVDFAAKERLSRVEGRIPGLREAVAEQLAATIRDESYREKKRAQSSGLASRASGRMPNAFFAALEGVEDSLQRVASGARSALAAAGSVVNDATAWEDETATLLTNDPSFSLDLERTREPRPPMPAPSSSRDAAELAIGDGVRLTNDAGRVGASTAPVAATHAPTVDTGTCKDWRVVAYLERRTVLGGYPSKGKDGRSSRAAALELRVNGTPHSRPGPFGYAAMGSWWGEPLAAHASSSDTFLFGIDSTTEGDAAEGLGWSVPLIAPSPFLRSSLGLESSGRFELADAHGPALVFRTWRSNYEGGEYELAFPTLCGSRILMRPDLFARLCTMHNRALAWREFIYFVAPTERS